MAKLSNSEIIKKYPIGTGLDTFRTYFSSSCQELDVSGLSNAAQHLSDDALRDLAFRLITALQSLSVARYLPSSNHHGFLFGDLARSASALDADDFNVRTIIPVLNEIEKDASDEAVLSTVFHLVTEVTPPPRPVLPMQQTPTLRNMSSLVNSSELRKDVDDVLKEELGLLYFGIPGFFKVFFGEVAGLELAAQAVYKKCTSGGDPLYREGSGWEKWPKEASEGDVFQWFQKLINQLLAFAEEHEAAPRESRKLIQHSNHPLQGSTAGRKLDVGFVDKLNTDVHSWAEIFVPGELKSNPSADVPSKAWLDLGRYVREVLAAQNSRRFVLGFTLCGSVMRLWEFDRLGGIASIQFDINQEGLKFVSAVLGFLWMSKEQLGFDPTIIIAGDTRYIEIERNNRTERLIMDGMMMRAPCIAGRATTCWRAHLEGDKSQNNLVIKDSWQYPEREEEGELLLEATNKEVKHVARYYHHETVYINEKLDDIRNNVRKGLDITRALNYVPPRDNVPKGLEINNMTSQSTAQVLDDSTRVPQTTMKRLSSHIDALPPPSKRTRSGSQATASTPMPNRVHRRVIIRDYGQSIYKASSLASFLGALEGCIDGYMSLYSKAGMLHRDISINNLIINEDKHNPSQPSFLIDLDLAIDKQRDEPSAIRGKTGTRAFMAIGLLHGEKHSFMHDLESFFWVLFWICIHYNESGKSRVVPNFEKWNYTSMDALATLKQGTVTEEIDFLRTVEQWFMPHYRPMTRWVNKLRKVVFPDGKRWKTASVELPSQMKKILRDARAAEEGLVEG